LLGDPDAAFSASRNVITCSAITVPAITAALLSGIGIGCGAGRRLLVLPLSYGGADVACWYHQAPSFPGDRMGAVVSFLTGAGIAAAASPALVAFGYWNRSQRQPE
jgi:hypothetical protein